MRAFAIAIVAAACHSSPGATSDGGRDGSGDGGGPAPLCTAASCGSWVSVASLAMPIGPAAVSGPDGLIYAIGGTSVSTQVATVVAYTPSTDSWRAAPSLLTPRAELAAVTGSDGRIYALGGVDDNAAIGTVEAYTPGSDAWVDVADMPTPRARFAAVASPDGLIYTIGGTTTGSVAAADVVATFEAFDPGTNEWTALPSLPAALYDISAAVGADGTIYVVGGSVPTVETYAPGSDHWQEVANLPGLLRDGPAAAAFGGQIYVFGGQDVRGEPLASAVVYTPSTDSWATVAPMQVARAGFDAVVGSDGRIYAVGPGTAVEAFTP